MKRTIIVACISVFALSAKAEIRDTINHDTRDYKDEIGYFQKANRDLNDPRFMFHDDKTNLDFGLGGTVEAIGFYGFGNELRHFDFIPGLIGTIPGNTPLFATKVFGSYLYFKARGSILGHSAIAYFKVGANSDYSLSIKQAYISIGGFSVGKIPSFFMDLEVGSRTTGVGLNTEVDMTHNLIGYRRKIGRFTVGAALEESYLELTKTDGLNLVDEYPPMPDITAHVKYKWSDGHVQLCFLYRDLAYRSFTDPKLPDVSGQRFTTPGWGLSASCNYKPTSKFKLSWEVTGGYGIGKYMSSISPLNNDVGVLTEKEEGYTKLRSMPQIGGLVSMQYYWCDKLSSSLVGSYVNCPEVAGVRSFSDFKSSWYGIINLFWYMTDYSYMGAEYMIGGKNVWKSEGVAENAGVANRIALVVAFQF